MSGAPPLAHAATRAEFEQRQRDHFTLTIAATQSSIWVAERVCALRDRDYPELLPPLPKRRVVKSPSGEGYRVAPDGMHIQRYDHSRGWIGRLDTHLLGLFADLLAHPDEEDAS